MSEKADWNPLSQQSLADPIGTDRELRTTCPVAYTDAYGGFFALFRHEDIVAVTRDRESFVSAPTISVPAAPPGSPPWVPLQSDLPIHRFYRRVLVPFFAASRLQAFEPQLRKMTNELIDGFIEKGETDLAAELCLALPAKAICLLLGLPLEDSVKLEKWTYDSIEAGSREGGTAEKLRVLGELAEYGAQWLERRRAEPADDVISAMLAAEIDGRPMTPDELTGMFLLLAEAGHETTSNALISSFYYLAEHPQQRAWLVDQPEITPEIIEEFLRYCAPVRGLARTATRDVVIGGRDIPAGSRVVLMFASGSRDEKVFDNADECLFGRDAVNHTTFGKGIHRCLGEHLARLEMKVVLSEFLRRIPDFKIAGPVQPAMWPTTGYRSLPVRFASNR
jgi:cytochrome P450